MSGLTVLERLREAVARGPVHLTLIDPEKTLGTRAAEVAREAEALGSFAMLLGGSTGIHPEAMGAVADAIHSSTGLPVIIFPQGAESLTRKADAILFLSLLNSRSVELVVRSQARAARAVQALHLEPIPTGYIVVAPGMKVGEVGQADCIAREDHAAACGYALAAQYFGMRVVYLEAGSGAPEPVPAAMIRAVKDVTSVPLVVGGGIRTREDVRAVLDGGADIVVTGTVVEEDGNTALAPLLDEVRSRRGR